MRFAERFMPARHAAEPSLLAIIAGKPAPLHVSSCALCQARLAELRAWVTGIAADAGELADQTFTPERLAAQQQEILRRLENLGRSARVIAFPAGTAALPVPRAQQPLRWVAAAACAGLVVGLASGRMFDRHTPAAPTAASGSAVPAPPLSATRAFNESLDEAALLDAAYDRVAIDALQTIDDLTPRAREVALASMPRSRR